MNAGTLPGVQLVSFDLDDTFWDCAPAIERAEAVLGDWLDAHAPSVGEAHRGGALLEHRARLLAEEPALAGDVSEIRKRSLAALFRQADAEHALSEAAYEVFYRARSDVALYDGVLPLLEALRPHYHVAAITNGNADLDVIGIASHFQLVLRATLARAAKPASDMFDEAAAHFGVPASQVLHVGDSAVTDVQGAKRAGCRACWFNPNELAWSGPGPAPDHEVDSIAALHRLLLEHAAPV